MKTNFFNFTSEKGLKMVNVKNIASIDHHNNGIKVTLNVTDENGINITFNCNMDWGTTTGQIKSMTE
tara:strand:+ start:78 stop:278 length:201 start_codon:yes stop_codon:yes gene_type:complete